MSGIRVFEVLWLGESVGFDGLKAAGASCRRVLIAGILLFLGSVVFRNYHVKAHVNQNNEPES